MSVMFISVSLFPSVCLPMVLRSMSSSSCCWWKELCLSLACRISSSSVFRSSCCFRWRNLKGEEREGRKGGQNTRGQWFSTLVLKYSLSCMFEIFPCSNTTHSFESGVLEQGKISNVQDRGYLRTKVENHCSRLPP